jgi:hypothetical protein
MPKGVANGNRNIEDANLPKSRESATETILSFILRDDGER